jgi:hypothetical protein
VLTEGTLSTSNRTPARETQCCYCGTSDQPMQPKDIHTSKPGYAWRLASACIDSRACSLRRQVRDAHLDTRFSLTPAGYAVLEAGAPGIHLTTQPGRYVADSITKPGVRYAVSIMADTRIACSCPGHVHHGHCKHADELARILSGKAVLRGAA